MMTTLITIGAVVTIVWVNWRAWRLFVETRDQVERLRSDEEGRG